MTTQANSTGFPLGELYERLVENFGHRYTELEIEALMFETLGHMAGGLKLDAASGHFFGRADEVWQKAKAERRR